MPRERPISSELLPLNDGFILRASPGGRVLNLETAYEHELLGAVAVLGDDAARIDAFWGLLGWIGIEAVQATLVHLLAQEEDALTLAGMIDALEHLPRMPQIFCRAAWGALCLRFEAKAEHSWMRCQALRGGLLVAQNDPGLIRRLQASILDVEAGDDGMFLRHVARS